MTRKETIRWLDSLKKDIGQSQHEELWHYAEALDVAIELLSTEAKTKCVAQIKVDTEEVVSRIKEEYDITDGWIPCSERLPKVGKYLVTWVYQNGDTEIGIDEWNDWHWCETPLHCGVIAWQPRPKPYEAEDDKEI